MKRSTLLWALLVIAILLCGLVRAQDDDDEDDEQDEEKYKIFKLKKILGSEWYSTFNKHQFLLVMFQDPAVCGEACQNALSQLRQAGHELLKEGLKKEDVYITYVDCSKQMKLCNKYDKKKYGRPVMSLFSKAVEIAEFNEGFSRENIVDFVHKHQNKRYLYSEEEVQGYAGPVIYGIFQEFDPKEPITEYAVFMKTAAHFFSQKMPEPEPRFALVTSKDEAKALAKKFGITAEKSVVAVVDGVSHPYKGDTDVEALNNWVFSLTIPTVIKADTTGTGYSYWKQGKPVVLFWLDYTKPIDEFVEMLNTVGQQYKGRLFILYEDGVRAERHMTWFGYSGQKFPAMIAFDTRSKDEYTFDENNELTKETIVSFIEDLLHRNLKKHVRKQKAPEEDNGPVKTLVYDNWREIVMDSPNDVVVFFYVPHCKFCLDFLETYASVAEELKGTPITFGKIDLDKNESPPPTAVRTFPTILFFPAGNKHQYKVFDDKRTRADLLDFYKTFASASFEVPLIVQEEPVQDIHHYKTINVPQTEGAEPPKTEHVHNMRDDL